MNKNPFWRLFGPLLLYWVIEFFARVIAEMAVLMPHMSEIIDFGSMSSSMTQDDIMNLAMQNMDKVNQIMEPYQVQIMVVIALCTVPLTLILFMRDRKRERILKLPQNQKAELKKYAEIIGLGAAAAIGLNALAQMANLAFYSAKYQETANAYGSAGFPVQLICLGIIIPVTEELMFRGVLFKRYRETGGFMGAAMCSALFFGLYHGNMVQFVYSFILGILLCYVYEKFGSFKAPVLLHIIANLATLVVGEMGAFTWMQSAPVRMGVTIIACAFVGSIMFVMIQKINQKPENTEPPKQNGATPDMFR